jgi:hypothetical protein
MHDIVYTKANMHIKIHSSFHVAFNSWFFLIYERDMYMYTGTDRFFSAWTIHVSHSL